MESLESLKAENRMLKDLLIDTENELETVRKLSKAELMKSQNLIKSVAPCLLGLFTEGTSEKFSQFSPGLDYNSSILLADQLERFLQKVSDEVVCIQKSCSDLKNDIEKTMNRSEKLAFEVKKQREVIKEMKAKKESIFTDLERMNNKNLMYEASLGNDPEPSVLRLLKLE